MWQPSAVSNTETIRARIGSIRKKEKEEKAAEEAAIQLARQVGQAELFARRCRVTVCRCNWIGINTRHLHREKHFPGNACSALGVLRTCQVRVQSRLTLHTRRDLELLRLCDLVAQLGWKF